MRGFIFRFSGLLVLPIFLALGHLAFSGWLPPPKDLTLEADLKLMGIQGALWVDAREEPLFLSGHVPGSVNLTRKNWDKNLPVFFAHYGEGQTIIVYCSVGCHESTVVAAKIRELGLENVQVLEGGYEAWSVSRPPKGGELRLEGRNWGRMKENSNIESRNPKQIPNLKSNETK